MNHLHNNPLTVDKAGVVPLEDKSAVERLSFENGEETLRPGAQLPTDELRHGPRGRCVPPIWDLQESQAVRGAEEVHPRAQIGRETSGDRTGLEQPRPNALSALSGDTWAEASPSN